MSDQASGLSAEAAGLIEELQAAIRVAFPAATFRLRVGPDGRMFLTAYTSAAHDFLVHDLVAERTVDAMIGTNLRLHVFPRPAG